MLPYADNVKAILNIFFCSKKMGFGTSPAPLFPNTGGVGPAATSSAFRSSFSR